MAAIQTPRIPVSQNASEPLHPRLPGNECHPCARHSRMVYRVLSPWTLENVGPRRTLTVELHKPFIQFPKLIAVVIDPSRFQKPLKSQIHEGFGVGQNSMQTPSEILAQFNIAITFCLKRGRPAFPISRNFGCGQSFPAPGIRMASRVAPQPSPFEAGRHSGHRLHQKLTH